MSENNSEISLKEIFLWIRSWRSYIWSRWMILFIAAIIGIGLGVLYVYVSKPKYTGDLVFVLSEGSKSVGDLASLAGSLGFTMGDAGGGDDAFSGDNILELLKSEKIIKGALFKPLPDTSEILVNLIIDKAGFRKNWIKKDHLKNLVPFPDSVSQLTPVQDSLVLAIRTFLVKNWLTFSRLDKRLSFYKVSTNSPDQRISDYLTRYIVEEASQFYISTKTKTARTSLDMLQHEADSIGASLNGKIYSMAETADQTFNLNPALMTRRAGIQQNQVMTQALGIAYGEVMKDLEIAKITLQKEKPLFQVIDEPSLPLVKEKAGMLKGCFIGGILAVLFAIVLLTFKRVIKKIHEE